MARSQIKRRQEAARLRDEAYACTLRLVSQRLRPPPDFDNAISEARLGFEADVLRDPSGFKPQMKTRDAGRLRLAAARYLFARYPVAAHLEQVWLDVRGLDAAEIQLRKRWYIVVAGGGSLYREGASAWLSRKEVHAFLNPPGHLGFDESLWHAIAASYAGDPATASRIASSQIARTPRGELRFWREVVRFFCANVASLEQMNDICDYLADCYRRDPAFSLKGRTLGSLGRQMRIWHRDLEAIERIEAIRRRAEAARNGGRHSATAQTVAATWPGAAIADWSWSPSAKTAAKRETYTVSQLRTAADLVAETRAMHHCVATYAAKCIAGHASIWTLRRRFRNDCQRMLTIELDRSGRIVQVRGFANRLALPEERQLLGRWAKARGLYLPA